MQFHPLHTERLILRPLQETDAEAIFSLRSSEEVNHYLDRKAPANLQEAAAFITRIGHGMAEGKSCYWVVTEKGNDQLAGTACIWNLSADGTTAELGYELLPVHQGKGIMREALKAVIDFAFEDAGLSLLEAWTHKDNQASTQLLLKHGFVLQPERKDPGNQNLLIFTRTKK